MKKRVFAALMAGVMGTMMFGITLVSAEAETPELKGEVYAFIAASLNNAMEELQKNFNETYPDVEILYNADSSGTLQTQIEEGARCDIFFSAAQKQMNALVDEGLADKDSVVDLLENKVVLIKPKDGETKVTGFENITDAANLALAGEDVPAIKSFDTEGIVIYAGSFSKILAPGIRVAYAVVPKKCAGAFTIGKQVSDVHTGVLNQMIVSRWFDEYDVNAHIENIRKIYKHKLDLMCDSLDKYCNGFITYVRPQGGLFIWAKLPDDVDMLDYVNKLVERKVAVVPGSAFMTDDTKPCHYIRLNFSTPSDENIVQGVKIMGEVAKLYK